MKISYINSYDILDSSTWIKTRTGFMKAGFNIAKSLKKQGLEVNNFTLSPPITRFYRIKRGFYQLLLKQKYYWYGDFFINQNYSHQMSKILLSENSDIVLFFENYLPIGNLNCKQSIVLWFDTTLAGLIDFYPYLTNLCRETKSNIYAMEKASLNKADLAIFSSDWAAKTAIDTYGIKSSKVKVIPWGANLETMRTTADVEYLINLRNPNTCKLLFIGIDWNRKRGNFALKVAKELNEKGLKTELLIVGCKPIIEQKLPDFIKIIGFIDSSTIQGREYLKQIFALSHFLILPTLADCSPHVLIEANSYGIPCLSNHVGGIPTIIKDNINGKAFPKNSSYLDYCNFIMSIMKNYSQYRQLALSSFNEYKNRLNRSASARSFEQLLEKFLKP